MRSFYEEEAERGERREKEFTLTSTTLLAIFFGMVLLCGLFFAIGFAVGRYGPNDSPTAGPQAAAQPASTAASSRPKPSASAQNAPEPQRAVVNLQPAAPSAASAAANPHDHEPVAASGNYPSQPMVKPAFPAQAYSIQPAPGFRVQPSVAPALSLMVQVAAVSHQEDAEVLVSALRKRGYAVSVRRQPSDSLLHVQIGPFTNHNDAYIMRQKLLSDGYNAIVQP
jgi:cell division septation protein DedD